MVETMFHPQSKCLFVCMHSLFPINRVGAITSTTHSHLSIHPSIHLVGECDPQPLKNHMHFIWPRVGESPNQPTNLTFSFPRKQQPSIAFSFSTPPQRFFSPTH